MPIERRDGYWLWVGGPVPPGASGITVGRLVAIRRGHEGSERLLRHELEHVAQYEQLGVIGFLGRYVSAYARSRLRGYGHRAAYLRIPFEASAEFRARRALGWGVVGAEVNPVRGEPAPAADEAAAPSPAAAVVAASPGAAEPSRP